MCRAAFAAAYSSQCWLDGLCGWPGTRSNYQTQFCAAARFWSKMPGERMQPAGGEATVCGLFVVTDDRTGLAVSVEPVRQGGRPSQAMPGVGSV